MAAVIETVLAASVAVKVPIKRALPLDLQIHELVLPMPVGHPPVLYGVRTPGQQVLAAMPGRDRARQPDRLVRVIREMLRASQGIT